MSLIPVDQTLIDANKSIVTYQSEFLEAGESELLYEYLLNNMAWANDKAVIYGKKIITKRKFAWLADNGFDYDYSGLSRIAQPWDPKILSIKHRLEKATGHTFNSCLLNLYHDGMEGMSWHSDDQNHLEPESLVAIISLGAERFFKLRRTNDKSQITKVLLEQGSLLLMKGQTQKYYQHEIPKMAGIKTLRISLTWRSMSIKKLVSK